MASHSTSSRPLSRRTFIKAVGGTGVAFALYAYLPGGTKQALAQIPGGTLNPENVPKYQTAMLIPPVMPQAGTIVMPGGKPVDY
jgi:spore coat protein A, manganese oxidase